MTRSLHSGDYIAFIWIGILLVLMLLGILVERRKK